MNQGPNHEVEANGLTVDYGRYLALDNVSFGLPAGAFMAIIGPNGGGKTTLLKLILGLLKPSSGSLSLGGMTPAKYPAAEIGYVPQVKTLDRDFPALPLELAATGLRRSWPWRLSKSERARAMAALDQARAGELAARPVPQLSGGELQRVYLARAMVRAPRLILLDEPATGMDAGGEADMFKILEAYQRSSGATILMITHDWEAAQYHASHVLILNRAVGAFGPPAMAMQDDVLRAAFGHVGHKHGKNGGRCWHGDHEHA